MKTIHSEHSRIMAAKYYPVPGVWRYDMTDGTKVYQAVVYFQAKGAPTGGIRGMCRLFPTRTAAERYRARARSKLGDRTI